MMESDDSDSDFEGFTPLDVQKASERHNEQIMRMLDESDIEISDLDSDSDEDEISDNDTSVDRDFEFQDSEWRSELSGVNVPLFTEETGPNHGLNPSAKPLEYFLLFFPVYLFELIANETNMYAQQKIGDGHDPRWLPTTSEEIRAFFCINIMMGIRQLPRISNYWCTDERFGDPYISSILTKTRFMKINQYLHLRDTTAAPGRNDHNYDPLYKVRTLIDLVLSKCKDNYKPGCNLSVDEGMIGFKGRLHFRQYMPAKPTKWGIKVWQICESDTGYCSGFDIYTGKKRNGIRQHGLGYDVVWNLSSPFQNQNRFLYFDRFFTSVTLAEHLARANTFMCGTVMTNRKGLPVEIKTKLKKTGDIIQMQKGRMLATSYKDKRQITFLSTGEQPGCNNNNQPHVNVKYNQHMGGVDRFDQMLSYYPVGRSGTKWWRYVLWYTVNLCIVNSWILYCKSNKDPPPRKHYDHLQFRADVAEQLRAGFSSKKHRVGRKSKNIDRDIASETISQHEMVHIEGRKKICRECSVQKRKTPKGRPIETSFMCKFCKVALCRVGCFTTFHDRNMTNFNS